MASEQDLGESFPTYQNLSGLRSPSIASEDTNGDPIFAREKEGSLSRRSQDDTEDTIIESVEYGETDEVDHHAREASNSGSARNSSGLSGNEAVFDEDGPHSSPTTSHHSEDDMDDLVSVITDAHEVPPSLSRKSVSSPYTPLKQRSPFRKTSSVRALQMETTPPPPPPSSRTTPAYVSSPRPQHFKVSTPSRNGTPRSQARRTGTAKKKEYPLVLLHVTLLPTVMPCSAELMSAILPEYILENYKLLREKITETVLERGILLPHPREDYDLLEDRLLESLELKLPRILKCGHFHLSEEEEAEIDEDDVYNSEDEDLDVCEDCGRRVRDGQMGSGSGHRRWNIKIFAANGLMRAGAWTAAWREMERVDVEIEPWMPEDLRREVEARKEMQEEEEAEHRLAQDPTDEEHVTGPPDYANVQTPQKHTEDTSEAEQLRLREIYGHKIPANVAERNQSPLETGINSSHDAGNQRHPHNSKIEGDRRRQGRQSPANAEIPLSVLLQNYILLLAHDKRNIAIALLSLVVLFLALGSKGSAAAASVNGSGGLSVSSAGIETPVAAISSSLPNVVSSTAGSSVKDGVEGLGHLIARSVGVEPETMDQQQHDDYSIEGARLDLAEEMVHSPE